MNRSLLRAAWSPRVTAGLVGRTALSLQLAALALLAVPSSLAAQAGAIPDAPKPQIGGVAPVAPGKGTTQPASGTQPASAATSAPLPDAPDQGSADSTLPSLPARAPDPDDGPAPDLPKSGESGAYLIVTRTNFVEVPFTVKDRKGNLVPGLTWRDVRVYENDLRQQMSVFTVDPFPLSVALVIDQSLPYDAMTRVNNALGALSGAFAPYDKVAVFTYNNGPKKQDGFTAGQSPRLEAIVERSKAPGREAVYADTSGPLSQDINLNSGALANTNPLTGRVPGSPQGIASQNVPREAHTLNDAILEAAKEVAHEGPDRRRIVYVISDGKEYGSTAKSRDVIKYLQTNRISVYATLVADDSIPGLGFLDSFHLPGEIRDNILPVYAGATGGQVYAEHRTPAIAASFAKITEQVRTQYTVGYYSREPAIDGKFRRLEVRVLRPNLSVIAKKGYYPQAAPVRQSPPVRPAAPAKTSSSAQPAPQSTPAETP